MQLADFGEIAPNLGVSSEQDLESGRWVEEAQSALMHDGAVLLRGPMFAEDGAERALSMIDDQLLEDAFWSTPRSRVGGKTLTATEYPSPRTISLHSEMAYQRTWPRFVAFHALQVAEEGGETTICDVDRLSREIGPKLETFAERGVTYRRTFQKRVDVPWQQAFQTSARADVEEVGRRQNMRVEWLDNDGLVTSHTAQGVVRSEAGDPLYFSQAHIFHASALEATTRAALERALGADRLPRQAFYGDGAPIADADLVPVREAFDRMQTKMCWRPGDILILDNMRFAHGRLPFKGARKLHVALARATSDIQRRPLFNA